MWHRQDARRRCEAIRFSASRMEWRAETAPLWSVSLDLSRPIRLQLDVDPILESNFGRLWTTPDLGQSRPTLVPEFDRARPMLANPRAQIPPPLAFPSRFGQEFSEPGAI